MDRCTGRTWLKRTKVPTDLGGAFTEFVRVIDRPVAKREMHKHLGTRRFSIPVGIQLMGSDLECLTASASNAADLEVPVLDLNFGCPARGAPKLAAEVVLDPPPPPQ